MWLTENAFDYGSVAVVGLAKNVGKTVTLNHLLRELHSQGRIGVTSIGIDGESKDLVTGTQKPEVKLYENMLFSTSETHYRLRRLQSEILSVGQRSTALGRLVTAGVLTEGKVMLSGPSDTPTLRALIEEMHALGAHTVVVDGALSRLSPASPAVSEALVLATGAALSPDIATIVKKTAAVCRLIELPAADARLRESLGAVDKGLWLVDEETGEIKDTGVKSTLEIARFDGNLIENGVSLYVSGMVNDRFLHHLTSRLKKTPFTLICRDFTRLFVGTPELNAFLARGAKIKVLLKPKLLGVTINPWSPQGFVVDGEKLIEKLREKLKNIPVTNLKAG